ncbi:DUF6048 family protein [Muriicola sp. Z0-33]|uniref:DUF6048 family protein n=1 Tax=Muriicola sp. Z0-33 TaxID=2816957 RepID=UPI002237C47F|nr:DUF6048 family protein [Muriicola sp. Z0-33]MCW5516501.1 hypothetical protein [Muriicola sp. Z0-33]
MLRYFISSCILLGYFLGSAQDDTTGTIPKDSLENKEPYGLRIGIDLSRPLVSFLNEDYTGLEFVGDYRLTQKLYLAAEIGNEKKTRQEELGNEESGSIATLYNFTSSGSYLKLGVDYNTYNNWYGMNNSIFIGGRYAISSFSQTLNSYSFYDSNRYWSENDFIEGSNIPEEFSGLNTTWLEFVFGAKAELFANFYLGASVRLGFIITNKEEDKFPNLWIPGFNRVTDGSKFGVGYNYSISYFLPLYRKAKKPNKNGVSSPDQ